MNQINCPICGKKCVKSGKTNAGSQRWLCKACKSSFTHKIDNNSKELKSFLEWLFGKEAQSTMPGEGRSFRRKTAKFWDIWTMPPKIEISGDVLFLDGIYLGRKACILICCDEKNVLVWYLCRYEHAGAWIALMKRIAEPRMVVSDGGTGFGKALKQIWPNAKHQRCIFHVFCQIKRYTNRIEGGINSRLREMLRNHRGLSIERRIKAVFWWCYMHSPEPLSSTEILNIMPTDKSIARLYKKMNEKQRLEKSLSIWGDAIVWSDLHNENKTFIDWD